MAENAKFAKYVEYEMRCFLTLGRMLGQDELSVAMPGSISWSGTANPEDNNEWCANSMLESFLLHTRVLHDFFWKNGSGDDITYKTFVTSWAPPEKPESLEKFGRGEHANKALFHLTKARIEREGEQKNWPIGAILGDLTKVINAFREACKSEETDIDPFRTDRPRNTAFD